VACSGVYSTISQLFSEDTNHIYTQGDSEHARERCSRGPSRLTLPGREAYIKHSPWPLKCELHRYFRYGGNKWTPGEKNMFHCVCKTTNNSTNR